MSIYRSIYNNMLLLSIFSVVTAFVLATTYNLTREQIQKVQREVEIKTLAELMSSVHYDNDLLASTLTLSVETQNLLNTQSGSAYYATLGNKFQAIVLSTTAPDGYNGNINMLIGIDTQGNITGLRITAHKETPGLGDKVSLKKSPWVLGFNNKGFNNLPAEMWAVKKDGGVFDAFTGATITPRAVVKRTKQTLELFHTKKLQWIHQIEQNTSTNQ